MLNSIICALTVLGIPGIACPDAPQAYEVSLSPANAQSGGNGQRRPGLTQRAFGILGVVRSEGVLTRFALPVIENRLILPTATDDMWGVAVQSPAKAVSSDELEAFLKECDDLGIRRLSFDEYPLISDKDVECIARHPQLTGLLLNAYRLNPSERARLTGKGVRMLSRLQSLEVLGISEFPEIDDEQFAGAVRSLSRLAEIDLGGCSRVGAATVKAIISLRGLHHVRLSSAWNEMTSLSSSPINDIWSLPELESAELGWSTIADDAFVGIEHAPKLKRVVLYGLRAITDTTRCRILANPNVNELTLEDCGAVQGTLDCDVRARLKALVLNSSQALSPTCLQRLVRPPLEVLSVASCSQVNDGTLRAIAQCESLKELDIRSCPTITDKGLAYLKDSPRLTTLNMSGCRQCSDRGVETVLASPTLVNLDISFVTSITGDCLVGDFKASQLVKLDLRGCHSLKADAVKNIKGFPHLREIDATGIEGGAREALRELKAVRPEIQVSL